MAQAQDETKETNYEQFRDSLSSVIIERLTRSSHPPKNKKRSTKKQPPNTENLNKPNANKPPATPSSTNNDNTNTQPTDTTAADGLTDFIDYIASEIFHSLPLSLQSLDHRTWRESALLQTQYPLPLTSSDIPPLLTTLDPSIEESLFTYGIAVPDTIPSPHNPPTQGPDLYQLLAPVLTAYITSCTTPPPALSSTRAHTAACEICKRDWINLTYHHLIPRMVHTKAVKRGWHRADELQNVAWICGACHRFVHHFADHETLARRYYTVELLLGEPDVVAFAEWAGRLRWKGLGGGQRRRRP